MVAFLGLGCTVCVDRRGRMIGADIWCGTIGGHGTWEYHTLKKLSNDFLIGRDIICRNVELSNSFSLIFFCPVGNGHSSALTASFISLVSHTDTNCQSLIDHHCKCASSSSHMVETRLLLTVPRPRCNGRICRDRKC